ncbi:HAMP domain-containing sensor histidine kinase [Cohnella silvisoli]|uniref:histidine kinase n=1 Tax=Cohnella silvisoli TaxID=2873699 RepID=A0ABV1KUA5_9BACL|nr:HAMP domain-containing sensor histidine kinase [Cohnella silvisoli]MCD9023120.1 HAMP domain-containing histidine kinase [Cohnella silvisoli]
MSIRDMLRLHYFLLVIVISAVGVVSILYASKGADKSYADKELYVRTAQDLVDAEDDDEGKASIINEIMRVNGWIEVLDSQNKVTQYIGTPLDRTTSESLQLDNDPEHAPYISSVASFSNEGNSYSYLVKIPVDQLEVSIWDKQNAIERDKLIQRYNLGAVFGFILLSSAVIFVYSRWTARKISYPLAKIAEGIDKLKAGDYTVRLELKLESEFLQIRDTLNDMAEKLERANEEKKQMEQDRQRMLADIAHDLKTPISTVYGYAKALHEGMVKDADKQKSYLLSIYNKAERVNSLMDTLFEMTQLDHPTFKLDKKEQDIGECMREIILEHFSEIEEKGIELEIEIPEEEVIYSFDREQLGRVISNLISNAVRYNPAGTRLRTTLRDQLDGIFMEIADDGSGIPLHLQSIIFEPFVRGDKARGNDGGTGLGLAIAQKIVGLHNGSLQLLSTQEEITIFRIFLPKI